jgi:hypothetical protein
MHDLINFKSTDNANNKRFSSSFIAVLKCLFLFQTFLIFLKKDWSFTPNLIKIHLHQRSVFHAEMDMSRDNWGYTIQSQSTKNWILQAYSLLSRNNQQDATLQQNLLFHHSLKAQHVSSGILLIIRSSNCICSLWSTYCNKVKDFVYITHSLY